MEYKELDSMMTESSGKQMSNESSLFRDLWEKFLLNWHWFALGLIMALSAAYLQLRYAENKYYVEAKILLKLNQMRDESELSLLTGRGFAGIGGQGKMLDQIAVMKSRRLVSKVVDDLDLNIRYFKEGKVRRQELYGNSSPIIVKVLTHESQNMSFKVDVLSDTDIEITLGGETQRTKFGKPIKVRETEFMILPQNNGSKYDYRGETFVNIGSVESRTNVFRGKIGISPQKDEGSILTLSIIENVPERGRNFIDKLVEIYNDDAVNDRRLIGEKTTEFINTRLESVSDDLLLSDSDVEGFKRKHHVTDLKSEASVNLSGLTQNQRSYLDRSTQLSMVESMQDYMQHNPNDLIPVNIGLSEGTINSNAQKYNELILARKDMLTHSTESSQIVKEIDQQIADVKSNLSSSLNNYKSTIQISLNSLQTEGQELSGKISKFPTQEKEFKDIARQQQIVEALYLFLLQKREENEITNSATPSPVKVVDFAYSGGTPVSPQRQKTYFIYGIVGLLIPFGILYVFYMLNNKIQTREDIEEMDISIIGDIPTTTRKFIKENDRSVFAESFRIMRTNLGFYIPKNKKGSKNVFITSTISGEGKTFIAANLAIILATSGKERVLLMGADIRKPRLLETLEEDRFKDRLGLSQYLADKELTAEDVIIKDSDFDFDIIHSGVIPPNPSELLMNGRYEHLMKELEKKYDYVVVDCAPMSLVTDTQIIAKNSDVFLYVIRVNYLDKRFMPMISEIKTDNKLPNMTIAVNDVGAGRRYGYGYGYAYGYGYGYGRGYGGYGYGKRSAGYYIEDEDEITGWRRFLPGTLKWWFRKKPK